MRYLSQLAHETTARVMPSREPSWLRPIPQSVQTHEIDAPGTDSDAPWPGPERSAVAFGPDAARVSEVRPAHAMRDEPAAHPQHAADDRHAPLAPTAPSPGRLLANTETTQSPSVTERHTPDRASASVRNTVPARVRPAPIETDASSSANEPAAWQREQAALPAREDSPAAPVTLRSVLADIARQQQELERRYREEPVLPRRDDARREASRQEGTGMPGASLPEREAFQLDIGAIVVQVEPERAATVPPRPPQRRAPSEASHRWRRSFLDR